MKSMKLLSRLVVALAVAEVLLVLLSWFLSATLVDDVRPLLSEEGARWFFAHFTDSLNRPLLVWMILAAMAGGTLWRSGLLSRQAQQRRALGLRVALSLLVVCVAVVLLLTVWPHALLLSATGSLWQSPFSRALVPVVAFVVIVCSMAFGLTVRTFTNMADVCRSFVDGLCRVAPLVVVYVMAMQFYESMRYVFF